MTLLGGIRETIRQWLIGLFAGAIARLPRPADQADAINWLGRARETVAGNLDLPEKLRRLRAQIDSRAVVRTVAREVGGAVKNYRSSRLPLGVKVALPATLAAAPFIGGQAAGIASFGGAIGVPLLLLFFLGTSGITAIIETVLRDPTSRASFADLVAMILEDERLRRASAAMKTAASAAPEAPAFVKMPTEAAAIEASLIAMDPYLFERHVMGFFQRAGLSAWVTRKSNDFGVDGFATHPEGLIIVQCKRYAPEHRIGRPAVQQFKGVAEEQGAWRGYLVTTSDFTEEAAVSAALNDKLVLVARRELINWHEKAPDFGHAPNRCD